MVGCVGNNGQNDIVLLCVAIQYFPTDRVILDIQGGPKNASLMSFAAKQTFRLKRRQLDRMDIGLEHVIKLAV